MKINLKICVFGTNILAYSLINLLEKNNFDISSFVTIGAATAKKMHVAGYPKKSKALLNKHKIRIFYVTKFNLNNKRDKDFFKKEKFDLGICAGWQRLIPQNILSKFKYGVFGWHGSFLKLPHGAGRSPINWSIRLGQKKIFHYLFRYNNSVDLGDTFEVVKIKIKNKDYISDLQDKVNKHISKSSIRLINSIQKNKLVLSKQAKIKNIIFPKITFNDSKIFTQTVSAQEAYDIIRSSSHPFPGSYLSKNSEKILIIYKSSIIKFVSKFKDLNIGSLFFHKKNFYLKLKDAFLKIDDYKSLKSNFFYNKKIICD